MTFLKRFICLTLLLGFASSCYSQSTETNTAKVPYGWSSGDIKANGITLHYYRTGNGSLPPVVLSHGFTDNGLCWTDLAHALEKKYDVVMYDLRGHGLSDAPATGYSIQDYTSDMAGLISELKLEHPVIIGHSLGGCIAASFAARYPDTPRKVVLIDPPGLGKPMFSSDEDMNRATSRFGRDINYLKGLSREELIKEAAKRHPAISEEARDRWATAKMQMKPQILESVAAIASLPSDLPKITAPTLILKADANDTTRKMELDAVSTLPNIRVYHVKGAGHLVHLERPDESLAVLNDFLEDSKKSQEQSGKREK
jgi:pimeloyl-ACP methyl ester carboxylesterase